MSDEGIRPGVRAWVRTEKGRRPVIASDMVGVSLVCVYEASGEVSAVKIGQMDVMEPERDWDEWFKAWGAKG